MRDRNLTVYMIFSVNRADRIEHSVSYLYLSGDISYSIICNANEEVNLKNIKQICTIGMSHQRCKYFFVFYYLTFKLLDKLFIYLYTLKVKLI